MGPRPKRARSWGLGCVLALGFGCSDGGLPAPDPAPLHAAPLVQERPATVSVPARKPERLAGTPELPKVTALDRNKNHVDDLFDEAAMVGRAPEERVRLEAIFRRELDGPELDAFVRAGGVVDHVFRAVSYGFTGTLPRSRVEEAAAALGPDLLLLKADRPVQLHMDESTRTGRARPVWAPGFAGSSAGFSGSSTITIAIVDTGVDASHPDLAGRMVGWKDYTAEAAPTPTDWRGHGSEVAGVALGSGAAFGVGPGTLRWTDHGNLTGKLADEWVDNPVHLPASFTLTSTATWDAGGSTSLSILRALDDAITGHVVVSGPSTGASPLSNVFTGTSTAGTKLSVALRQNATLDLHEYVVANSVTGYPPSSGVADAFPPMRGVASMSGWFGAKVFAQSGQGSTNDIAAAMDDLVVLRTTHNIKVVNLSFSIDAGGEDTTQRAKANTMVERGMVVVASAGNNGPSFTTGDPGRAGNVITVGATNDANALTEYTSRGSETTTDDTDLKPDILAPGGSLYRSKILTVDSNTRDTDTGSLPDVAADDYTPTMGTSIAAPFVSGAAALVIGALAEAGHTWSFDGTASPWLVKTLLLASATETNKPRESNTGDPPLGRGASLKDSFEGYGLVNPDAAVEAVLLTFQDFSGTTTGASDDRRAWGRKLVVPEGRTVKVALTVPEAADFDLYLYDSTPGPKGNPVLRAASDRPGVGVDESLAYTSPTTSTFYVFVKRISGGGTFAAQGWFFTCGDGKLEPGEQCDDGNVQGSDCCSSTCQHEADGNTCKPPPGGACPRSAVCRGGLCVGEGICAPPDDCHTATCTTGECLVSPKPDGAVCSGGRCSRGNCIRTGGGFNNDVELLADGDGLVAAGGGCGCQIVGGGSRGTREPRSWGGSRGTREPRSWGGARVPLGLVACLAFAAGGLLRRRRARTSSP